MDNYNKKWDVVIAGAGPAGLTAAIAAKRLGAEVLLIEKNGFVGGLASSGIPLATFHDNQGNQVIKGIPEEIIDYLVKKGASLGHVSSSKAHTASMTPLLPEETKYYFHKLISDYEIDLLLECCVIGTANNDDRIIGLELYGKEGKFFVEGKIFIDCTGDGAIIHEAQASYDVGRNSDGLCQSMTLQFTLNNVNVDKASEYFTKQIYKTNRPGNNFPSIIHIMGKLKTEIKNFEFWAMSLHENELTVNATDMARYNPLLTEDITKAHYEGRKQINYIHETLKKDIKGFEKSYISASFNFMGIRESRRLNGVYSLTKNDVIEGRRFKDVIAKSGYCMDMHSPVGKGIKFTFIKDSSSYDIPYRCLIPDKINGILVAGRCISASHEALSSVRVMANCMAMGQAAGTAAYLSVKESKEPRDIDVSVLQNILEDNGVIL